MSDALAQGEKPAKEVQREARTLGISEITINRTKRALGIKSKKLGGNFGSKAEWYWSLPTEDDQDDHQDDHTLRNDHLQASASPNSTSVNNLTQDDQSSISDHLDDHLDHLQETAPDQSTDDREEGEL